jgi:type I restriction enzyme, S subunit
MSEWTKRAINDLIEDKWPGEWGTEPTAANSVVVYRSTELDDEGHLNESGGVLRAIPTSKLNAKRLVKGDILLEASGGSPERPVGRVAIFTGERTEPAICANFLRTLRPKSTVHSGFLRWQLMALHRSPVIWRFQQQTTGMINLKVSDYLRHEIDIPREKTDQGYIAEILGTVDEVIEQTEALIAKQQQVKGGLMHDLFTRGLTPDGQLRPIGTGRKTKFGWLPQGWRIGSLADATSPARQPILTGPFGADLGNDDFVEEGVPVLRIGNVQTGRIDVSDLLYVTPAKAATLERYRIRSGDLLFARQGATTGRNALASDEVDGWLINYHIIRVALDHSLCAPVFIEAAFNEEMVLRQVERDKGRGTREGINSEQLRSLELPLPGRDEQIRIADRLIAQQRVVSAETVHLAKLRQLKHGLMQALLTPPA